LPHKNLRESDKTLSGARRRARRILPAARRGPLLPGVGLLALLSLTAPGLSQGGERPEQSRADYRIQARLEGKRSEPKILKGRLDMIWDNRSGATVSDLWFHLYLNAFSNNRSTLLHEERGEMGGIPVEDGWGWSQITGLQVTLPGEEGPQDVLATMRYRQPDDGREEDRTVFSIDLPRPLSSGESVQAHIEWTSKLPDVWRRTGAKGDFLLVAQWFPKLGVYELGRGWNCHQFHASSEFFADYGTYDVRLDLPARFDGKIGGSGIKELERRQGNRVEVRFVAPSFADQRRVDRFGLNPLVHDFVWTADPRYEVHHYTFRYGEWAERYRAEIEAAQAALGVEADVSMRDVDVTVLIHPERDELADRHFRATSAALFFFGLWFGEYPYQHVTVVDPAWGAEAAGGMEYPTLFTCGTELFTSEDMHRPESVVVHECGHQFWGGLVGSNEFEAGWLDEGLTSYTDSEVLWRVWGPRRATTDYARLPVDGVRVASLPGGGVVADLFATGKFRVPLPFLEDLRLEAVRDSVPANPRHPARGRQRYGFLAWWRDQPRFTFVRQHSDPRWADRSEYLSDPDTDPIDTYSWKFADHGSYHSSSYQRTAVFLRTLRALIGEEAFLRGMRHYSSTWRYRHPYPADFFATFQEGAGVEIDAYFDELFRGTDTIDWSVEVEQRHRLPAKGYFQSEGGAFLVRPEEDGEEGGQTPWEIEVFLQARGGLHLPLPLRLTFADGTTRDLEWTREEQKASGWKRLRIDHSAKLVSAVLDPERGYYLDRDMSNNQWYEEEDPVAPWRWGERVLAQFQHYFHWIGGIGG
jgi:hypothetical protein